MGHLCDHGAFPTQAQRQNQKLLFDLEVARSTFTEPAIHLLYLEAPLTSDPESGQLLLLQQPIDRRAIHAQISGEFLSREHLARQQVWFECFFA